MKQEPAKAHTRRTRAASYLGVILAALLAITMIPAAAIQPAYADEPSAGASDLAVEGLLYKVTDEGATLVGFEDGGSLDGDLVVPETVGEGVTVVGVAIAEGQAAQGVTALTLPQTVESVKTEGLAVAFPALGSIVVDGTAGTYSSSGGMLFLQGRDTASSDGSTTLARNRELVWAPPTMVVARLPIECKSIAAGAFVDAAALETVMSPGTMESIAAAEKDDQGNVVKPGAFTDEQIVNLSIVVPGTNIASPDGDRVSASVALSEDEGMEAKREAWWKYGFNSDKIVMGAPFGEVEGIVTVSTEGTVEDASIDILKPYEKKQLTEAAEAGDASAAERLAAPEGNGLSFSYNADMNLSVFWAGDKTATPANIEIPAYVAIDGVKYAVTEIAPEGFKGAVFLTSVTIPEGVTRIGDSAFEDCANLKTVNLPSTLKTIDYAAFKGCTALESANVPDTILWIGGEAFEDKVSEGLTNYRNSNPLYSSSQFLAEPTEMSAYSGTGLLGSSCPRISFAPDEAHIGFDHSQYLNLTDNNSIYWARNRSVTYYASITNITPPTVPGPFDPTSYFIPVIGTTDGNFYCSSGEPTFSYAQDSGVLITNIVGNRRGKTWIDTYGDDSEAVLQDSQSYAIKDSDGNFDTNYIWTVGSQYGPEVSEVWSSWIKGSEIPQFFAVSTRTTSKVTLQNNFTTNLNITLPDSSVISLQPGQSYSVHLGVGAKLDLGPVPHVPDHHYLSFDLDEGDSGSVQEIAGRLIYTAGSSDTHVGLSLCADTYNMSLKTNGGAWNNGGNPDKTSYSYGDTYTLPRNLDRRGFWFGGWYPTSTESDWKQTQDAQGMVTAITPDAYGDVTFNAVWIPMTYSVDYNVEKALISDLPDKTFIHPRAAMHLRTKTGYIWPDGTRYTGSEVVSGSAPNNYSFTNTDFVDLSGLSATTLVDFDLAECALTGYTYQGWCTDETLKPGETSPTGSGVYTNVYTLVDKDGSLDIGTSNMEAIFGANWQSSNEKPNPMPKRTLYGVWANTDMITITLEANEPAFTNNMGNDVVKADDKGSATPGTQSIRFWNDHGYIGQAPVEGADNTYTETAQPSTPVRTGSTGDDTAIDTAMGLLAPVRYGFQFMGWGNEDGTLYISYDENAGRTKNKEGFKLTVAGAELIKHSGNSCALKTDAPTTWKSIWKIRTIDVSLRIPSPAVESVDVTGASTGADRGSYADANLVTNAAYDDYKWREGTSGETGGGSTSSWYIAKRTWNYGDVLEMPAFKPRDGYYSYDGWFDKIKPSDAVSTDKALEADPGITKIATFEGLRPHKANMLVSGLGLDKGLNIPDDFFLTGVDAGTNSAKELWLWVSPIRINVSSPIGIYLCQTNSYGVGVEPYVVGNDTRTQLESRAEFQVAMNSHDLQIVGIEAEDVVDVTKEAEKDAEGNETGKTVDKITTVNDTGFTAADGFCRQIIEPTYKSKGGYVTNDNYEYGTAANPNEGSRMFWVSPVPTATADQQGVIYGGSQTAASAGGSAATSTLTAQEEKDLVPDVNKRRYFGYGYTLDKEDLGDAASLKLKGADGKEVDLYEGASVQDNTINDTLDNTASSKKYLLGNFVLRARDDSGDILTKGLEDDERGLAYLGKGDGNTDTYRFYYGLDMRRCSFDLAGLQNIIENSAELDYNSAFDQPLLKVKFTFAAARNSGISYYSARMGETVDFTQDDGIPAETTISIAG